MSWQMTLNHVCNVELSAVFLERKPPTTDEVLASSSRGKVW